MVEYCHRLIHKDVYKSEVVVQNEFVIVFGGAVMKPWLLWAVWSFMIGVVAIVMTIRQFLHKGKVWLSKYEASLFEDENDAYTYAGIRGIYGGVLAIVLAVLVLIESKNELEIAVPIVIVGIIHSKVFLIRHSRKNKK